MQGNTKFLFLLNLSQSYLGLRSGGPKQLRVGMSSLVGFRQAPVSALQVGGGARGTAGERSGSSFSCCWGEELRPRQPRAGERQWRRALNCRSSSPSRFPKEVRRTGLLRLGSIRFLRDLEAGERWKYSSGSASASTMDGSLCSGRCPRSVRF